MSRWEPDAQGRLGASAMKLFLERGYEQTTVADIADDAGLTSRTFFRYFTDKREVLFGGSNELVMSMVAALEAMPLTATPRAAIEAALQNAAEKLGEAPEYARRRAAIIRGNRDLIERELIKLATLGSTLTTGLRKRGIPEIDARLMAEAGMAVFRVAFEQWLAVAPNASLPEVMAECAHRLSVNMSLDSPPPARDVSPAVPHGR